MTDSTPVVFRPMTPEDWPQVAEIYAEGIATGHATFEMEVPPWVTWDAGHMDSCRIVAVAPEEPATVLGWAALSPVSSRCVYAGVGEVSVYVRASERGRGLGTGLLARLCDESEEAGLWTLRAGIFPENQASIRAHERCGFRILGTQRHLGQMRGVWRDVVLLERRSDVVGVPGDGP